MNTHTAKPDIIYSLNQLLRLFSQEVNKPQISPVFFICCRFFAILRPMWTANISRQFLLFGLKIQEIQFESWNCIEKRFVRFACKWDCDCMRKASICSFGETSKCQCSMLHRYYVEFAWNNTRRWEVIHCVCGFVFYRHLKYANEQLYLGIIVFVQMYILRQP